MSPFGRIQPPTTVVRVDMKTENVKVHEKSMVYVYGSLRAMHLQVAQGNRNSDSEYGEEYTFVGPQEENNRFPLVDPRIECIPTARYDTLSGSQPALVSAVCDRFLSESI